MRVKALEPIEWEDGDISPPGTVFEDDEIACEDLAQLLKEGLVEEVEPEQLGSAAPVAAFPSAAGALSSPTVARAAIRARNRIRVRAQAHLREREEKALAAQARSRARRYSLLQGEAHARH